MRKNIFYLFLFLLAVLAAFFCLRKLVLYLKSPDPKIAIITDIHRCSPPGANAEDDQNFKKFMEEVQSQKADVIINLGDLLSYRLGQCQETADNDLEQSVRFLGKDIPFYSAAGDHDVDGPDSLDAWKKTSRLEKTYYSFLLKDIQIIVLDTVSGGGEIKKRCEEDENCQKLQSEYESYRDTLKSDDEEKRKDFLAEHNMSQQQAFIEKERLKDLYFQEEETRKKSRSFDKGKILDEQLGWLENELRTTKKDRVLIASHHPLFRFDNGEKIYEITNADRAEKIMRESGKNIIVISGDAHSWHEEAKDEKIKFYIINRFSTPDSQLHWAFLKKEKDDYTLDKIDR